MKLKKLLISSTLALGLVITSISVSNADTKKGWIQHSDKWYYFDSNGVMQTGWKLVSDNWYYLESDGTMATGWRKINNIWYYLEPNGMMATGWKQISGVWYYLESNGAMATGWKQLNGEWYYLQPSGKMATGWESINRCWYYLLPNGVMSRGWQQIGTKWYYLEPNGAMATGWKQLNGEWYYLQSSGEMATGWEFINGKWYYFYSSGVMATNATIDGWQIASNGVAKPIMNNDGGSLYAYQKEVLNLVNAERAKNGLKSLTLNTELSNVATIKSQDMVDKNYFDHQSPTYGSPFDMMKQFGISYRAAGENIAMGHKSPQEVVNAWMNSPGHRRNILSSSFTELGVGIAKNDIGYTYWTQMFVGK